MDRKAEMLDNMAERYDSRALRMQKRIERMKEMNPEEQKKWLENHKSDKKGKHFHGKKGFGKNNFHKRDDFHGKRMNPEIKEKLKETCLETDNGKKIEPFNIEKAKAKLMSSERFVNSPEEKQAAIIEKLEEFNKLTDSEKREIENFKQEHLIKICGKLEEEKIK